MAYGITGLLRALPWHARAGQVYLPADILTRHGVTREDIGEATEGDLGTLKAASSDALKRCAVHFGVGRYLYDLPLAWADWDDQKRAPETGEVRES